MVCHRTGRLQGFCDKSRPWAWLVAGTIEIQYFRFRESRRMHKLSKQTGIIRYTHTNTHMQTVRKSFNSAIQLTWRLHGSFVNIFYPQSRDQTRCTNRLRKGISIRAISNSNHATLRASTTIYKINCDLHGINAWETWIAKHISLSQSQCVCIYPIINVGKE